MLEHVQLVHQSLPELAYDEVDTSVRLLGKRLRAPLLIAAMTGGSDASAEVNRELSSIADARGYGFGLGSQRAMQRSPETAWTYEVRAHAKNVLLLGNVGVVQARQCSSEMLAKLARDIGADALCVHMNPAMELIQAEGDRDFRGCLETFARLARELPIPVVAKETGNGISRADRGALAPGRHRADRRLGRGRHELGRRRSAARAARSQGRRRSAVGLGRADRGRRSRTRPRPVTP